MDCEALVEREEEAGDTAELDADTAEVVDAAAESEVEDIDADAASGSDSESDDEIARILQKYQTTLPEQRKPQTSESVIQAVMWIRLIF